MNDKILLAIITGIIGFLSGVLLPFVKWHIEKLKMRRLDRIELIKQLREFISSNDFSTQKFKNTILYSRFREFLPEEIIEHIDCKDGAIHLEVTIGGRRGGMQNKILDQICIIEKKWKLI